MECIDRDNIEFEFDADDENCEWLRDLPEDEWREVCKDRSEACAVCRVTCGACVYASLKFRKWIGRAHNKYQASDYTSYNGTHEKAQINKSDYTFLQRNPRKTPNQQKEKKSATRLTIGMICNLS